MKAISSRSHRKLADRQQIIFKEHSITNNNTVFLKEHLQNQYNWNAQADAQSFTGSPTRRLFNRFNGDQVLFIINSYAESNGKMSIEEGQKIEEVLSQHLPLEAKSEITVVNWVKEMMLEGREVS